MALVDANGLTEEEFLAAYKQKDYPKPSLTADIAIFRPAQKGAGDAASADAPTWEILLIRRGGHPYLGCWALPGGFVGPKEDCDHAALRELNEETNLSDVALEQFGLYSTPGRDPRAWTVSGAYIGVVDRESTATAGDDAADAQWFTLSVEPLEDQKRYQLTAYSVTQSDEVLSAQFEVLPQLFGAPRCRVTAKQGFAFDHAQIITDAFLTLGSLFD